MDRVLKAKMTLLNPFHCLKVETWLHGFCGSIQYHVTVSSAIKLSVVQDLDRKAPQWQVPKCSFIGVELLRNIRACVCYMPPIPTPFFDNLHCVQSTLI